MTQPRVIRSNEALRNLYNHLDKNDIVCGRIKFNQGEEPLLTDLVERGVRLIPSGTSQLLSKSKVFQTQILGEFLPPNSVAVFNQHGFMETISRFNQHGVDKVVLKLDRTNGGLGIHIFPEIESLYNHICCDNLQYPFVIQPHIQNARDIRVVIIGKYIEAYERLNQHNFRNNLHCGGEAKTFNLTDAQVKFCENVMKRGAFPYAHLDLILKEDGSFYLLEVNLRGGLRGAKLTGKEYLNKTNTIHEELLTHSLKQA